MLKDVDTIPDHIAEIMLKELFSEKDYSTDQDEQTRALLKLAQSVMVKQLMGKCSPKVIADTHRPLLSNPDTVWSAIGQLPDDQEICAQLVPELTKALHNENESVRYFAAKTLGYAGPAAESALPLLIKAMKEDSHESVRTFSAQALGKIGKATPEVIRALMDMVLSEDEGDFRADEALMQLDFDGAPYHDEWLKMIYVTLVPDSVIRYFKQRGAESVADIVSSIQRREVQDIDNPAEVLRAMGSEIVGVIEPLLNSDNNLERLLAIEVLVPYRNEIEVDPQWMVPFFEDKEVLIACKALEGYVQSTAELESKIRRIKKFLAWGKDAEDSRPAYYAMKVARGLGKEGDSILPLIEPYLESKDNYHHETALFTALHIDLQHKQANTIISRQLQNWTKSDPASLIYELERYPAIGKQFTKELLLIMNNKDAPHDLRLTCQFALKDLGYPDIYFED